MPYSWCWLLKMTLSAPGSVILSAFLSHWGSLFSFKHFTRKGWKWLCSSEPRVDHCEHLGSTVGSWSVIYALRSWGVNKKKAQWKKAIFFLKKENEIKSRSMRKYNWLVCHHLSKMHASNHLYLLSSVCIIRSTQKLVLYWSPIKPWKNKPVSMWL